MGRRLRPASLYPTARGSVLVPLALFGLPKEIQALQEPWAVKEAFHVTATHTPWLAQRAGTSLDRAGSELSAALDGPRARPVRLGDELRLVREGEERTLVVMAPVDGLGELYTEALGPPRRTAPTAADPRDAIHAAGRGGDRDP
jgi:hypothetical protein